MNRGRPVAVFPIGVGTGLQQDPGRIEAVQVQVVIEGPGQRQGTEFTDGHQAGAGVCQQLEDGPFARVAGDQRTDQGHSVFAFDIHVGSGLDQQLHDIHILAGNGRH